MKRALALIVVAVVAWTGTASASTSTSTGTFRRYRYAAKDPTFTRNYWVYTPARRARPTTLVVVLHGCYATDPVREAATGMRWNKLAYKRGLIVVYPEQRIDQTVEGNAASRGNGLGCWNWFDPVNQERASGEAATIAGITRRVAAAHDVDERRVFLTGASAGGAMAVNMAAAYPDLYAAVAIFSACAYRTCTDVSGSAAYAAMGRRARVVPMLYAQGTLDHLTPVPVGEGLVQQWLGTSDLADNGAADLSVSRTPAAVTHHGFDESLVAGLGTMGDTCVRPMHWGCPGGWLGLEDSYPYSVRRYEDARGRTVVESWLIHGLMHAYPKGDPDAQYTDPLGPDVTAAAYRFFRAHPMKGSR